MTRISSRQNLFFIIFTIALFVVVPARAQSVGGACSAANFTSPVWVSSGTGGQGSYLVCDGSNWVQFLAAGADGILKVGEASGVTCNAAAAGALRYDSGNGYIELCDGTSWESIASEGVCDGSPHSFNFTDQTNVAQNTLTTSNILLITGTDSGCSVTVSVSGGDSPNFRVCGNSSCSTVVQDWTATNTDIDMNGRYLQLRDTTASTANTTVNVVASVGGVSNTWSIATASSGSCGASPTIGETCPDGTVYAGQSPDGYVDMYVARCDAGMSWGGSSCTGTRSLLPWNNNNSGGMVNTGFTSHVDGDVNTAGIILQDSDSVTAGVQPHQAAQACADLSVHGHTDWYLPARDELDVIYENLMDGTPNDDNPDPLIDGFTTSNYWTSSDSGSNYADIQNFSNGAQNSLGYRYWEGAIRCARRD